jgi:winged helix DNA-binding protein
MPKSDALILSPRALNRALLARQMLLERAAMPAEAAIEHLVALQAQVPRDPYFGLWARLQNFDPEDLSSLIATRNVVRMASLRATVHLSTAKDARILRPWVQPMVTRVLASTPFGKSTRGVDHDALVRTAAAAVAGTPMTLAKLRPALATAFPEFSANDLSYVFHYLTPLVQVPPRGLWQKSGAPKVTTLEAWVGKPLLKAAPEKLVLRYLAAFGPASVADTRAWSGLSNLAPLFERLRGKLVTFRDARGTELFDLPGAPRPEPDAPAPPRFLPSYDNAIIAFANRDRILPGGGPIPFRNINVGTFLLDGFFAGFWSIKHDAKRARLVVEATSKLRRADQAALAAEGRALLAFAAPGRKPEVAFASS